MTDTETVNPEAAAWKREWDRVRCLDEIDRLNAEVAELRATIDRLTTSHRQ